MSTRGASETMNSLEEGKEMQRQTLYLQSIAASLLVLGNNTVGFKDDDDRSNQRRSRRAFTAAAGDGDMVAQLEHEVERLEARIKKTHSHEPGEVHVSREEYNAWSEFWVAAWDALEVKESATTQATLRYTAAFARLSALVGMPDEHRLEEPR